MERITNKDGNRLYVTPKGAMASVTTILSATRDKKSADKLRRWQHKMDKVNGTGAAEKYRLEAAARGTKVHEAIECYYRFGEIIDLPYEEYPYWIELSKFIKRWKPHTIERPVFHPYGYAGTADFVGYEHDTLILADWKTSKRPKRLSWIKDYLLQVTAYILAWNHNYPKAEIEEGRVVICAPPNSIQVFDVDPEEYKEEWLERLAIYHDKYGNSVPA